MKKVSIFSKDYEKLMKRRKRIRITVSVILILAIVLGGIVYLNFDTIKQRIAKGNNQDNVEQKMNHDKNNNDSLVDDISKTNLDKQEDNSKKEELDHEKKTVTLSNNVKIDYDIDKKSKSIMKVQEDESFTYQLNDDKNMAIVFFGKTSELFSFSINGTVKKLSYDVFVDANGKTVKREEFLKYNPSFIWMESPTLYKDKIYYATKLPNLNNNNRYFLWVYDMSTEKHSGIYDKSLRAHKIIMGNITEKGLSIEFDGKVRYFNEKGKEVR